MSQNMRGEARFILNTHREYTQHNFDNLAKSLYMSSIIRHCSLRNILNMKNRIYFRIYFDEILQRQYWCHYGFHKGPEIRKYEVSLYIIH